MLCRKPSPGSVTVASSARRALAKGEWDLLSLLSRSIDESCVEMLTALVASPSLAPAPRPAPSRARPPRMVAYRVPQPTKEEWIRSHGGLYGSRVLYLGQEIDDEEMNRVIAELLFLDAEEVANHVVVCSRSDPIFCGLAAIGATSSCACVLPASIASSTVTCGRNRRGTTIFIHGSGHFFHFLTRSR